MLQEEIIKCFSQAGIPDAHDLHVLTGGYTDFACTAIAGGKKYVFKRISPNFVADDRPSFLRMEIAAYALVGQYLQIPIPKVYYADVSKPNDEFFIMEFVEGQTPRIKDYSASTPPEEWDKIGKLIADFHLIVPPNKELCGFPRMGGLHKNWYEAAHATVLDSQRMLGKSTGYLRKLLKAVEKHRSILENVETTYVHGDMWVNNLIRQEDGKLILFDFGACMVGDPIMDLLFFDALRPLDQKTSLLDAYNRYAKKKVTATYEEQVRFFICMALYGIQDIDHMKSYKKIPPYRKMMLWIWLKYYVDTGLKGLETLEKNR